MNAQSVNKGALPPEFYTTDYQTTRGRLVIACCRSGYPIASSIVEIYRQYINKHNPNKKIVFLDNIDTRFIDGEVIVDLKEDVRGADVFLIQSFPRVTDPSNPYCSIDDNLNAYYVALRAFREHKAANITGILPYHPYARQNAKTHYKREPTTLKLVADLSKRAGLTQLITWEPHCDLSVIYDAPVDLLEALSLFVNRFEEFKNRDDVVIVAPDAGAQKKVTFFAEEMNLGFALGSKFRPEPGKSKIQVISGDLRNKKIAIILDDMIAGGGTVSELTKKLVMEYGIEEVYIAVSHNLCLPDAYSRLVELNRDYCLKGVVVTNSIPQTEEFVNLPFFESLCLSGYLCRTINSIHYNRSVSAVFK